MDKIVARNLIQDLSSTLSALLPELPFAFFLAEDDDQNYFCLASQLGDFSPLKTYSPFRLPGMVRVLGQKAKLFSENCLEEESKHYSQYLCLILKWLPTDRRVLILSVDRSLDPNALESFLQEKKSQIKAEIDRIFDKYEA